MYFPEALENTPFTFSIADGSLPEPGVSGPQDAGPSSGKHELYLTKAI